MRLSEPVHAVSPRCQRSSFRSHVSWPLGIRRCSGLDTWLSLLASVGRASVSWPHHSSPSSRSSSSLGSSRTSLSAMCYVPSRSGFGTYLLASSTTLLLFLEFAGHVALPVPWRSCSFTRWNSWMNEAIEIGGPETDS